MKRSSSLVLWAVVFLAMLVMASPPAYGQGAGTSASLSGLVVDTSGGVMPGVDVVVKNNATAATSTAVTDGGGRFTVPALNPGTYTVTLSLTGFKTVVLPDIQVVAATPQSVKVMLELGKIEETVVVTGAAEIVQTQTAAVQTTIVVQQIQQLPLVTHTALDYVVHLPGVSTAGSNSRGSTISGLPQDTISITLDGINVQDNRGSDKFFMYIRPMMDSVEEITVSTANPGAESSGSGATQIRMVTRAGGNRFTGSAYNTWRNQAGTNDKDFMDRKKHPSWIWRLNTPYWFNKRDLPKTAAGDYYINDVRLQTPGFRLGGPILKDKLFYFFNSEWFLLPESRSRQWYILNENARQGILTYAATDGSGDKTLNVLAYLASKPGLAASSTPDPTIAKLLVDIRQAASTEGAIATYNLNVDKYDYVPTATQKRIFPTLRLDYNVANAHRVTFSARYNKFDSQPDFLNTAEARFPGFPNHGGQVSDRYMWQGTLRSTFGRNIVNEARVGKSDAIGKGTYFGYGVNEGQFNCTGLGCQSLGGVGWNIGFPGSSSSDPRLGVGLTGATGYGGKSAGVANSFSFEDTLTWLKGKHSISMGASWQRVEMRNWNMTPFYTNVSTSVSTLDPAYQYMTTAALNAEGIKVSDTGSSAARGLYAFLTGRITSMGGTAYLADDDKYYFNGERTNQTTSDDIGFFVSDAWRVKPNLTVTGGVRYQVQLPMTTDGLYSRPETWQMVYGITGAGSGSIGQGNLYQPGLMTGSADLRVVPYEKGSSAYNTDWNNVAPSIGVAWRPNLGSSFLTKILSTDPVFRGGYSMSFTRLGTSFFDGNYSGNPGRTRAASRGETTGTPYLGVDTIGGPQVFPVLFRDYGRLFPSQFPESPTYPITPATNETLDIHYPDWPIPYTHQYSFGFQRELGKSMAIDIRYVGNTNVGAWTTWNMNSSSQWNILENGWYDEFRKAQANLRANIIAGKGNTFAYMGPGTGTSPLPVMMAYFAGFPLNDPRNQDPANYATSASSSACSASTGTNLLACFKSSSWYNNLNMYSPSVTGMVGTGTNGLLNRSGAQGALLFANAAKAGLPANFFQPNPTIYQGNAYLETNGGNTQYNSLQFELRRRMSQGLLVQGSYVVVLGRKTWTWNSLRENWYYVDSTGGPMHAIKFNWVYELPFGRGKQYGGGVSRFVDTLIGGWEFDGVGRIQSGSRYNFGGYRLVGMTEKDLQKMFKFYKRPDSTGKTQIYMFPQDVIDNTILAIYKTSAITATGYSGAAPTGRYLAPASSADCASYIVKKDYIRCSGTVQTRMINGPWYWKFDMSFVKRIAVVKNMRIEARMDLYNIFDTINFASTTNMGENLSDWRVTSAATDTSASQDPGGRVTSFGLRFTW